MSLDEYSQALLRSVATACQTAVQAVQVGVGSGTIAGLESGLQAAEGALSRASTSLGRLRKRLPSHSRAVRLGQKALDRALEAHGAAEPTDGQWPDASVVARCSEAAVRATQVILVDTDGRDGWAAQRQAG